MTKEDINTLYTYRFKETDNLVFSNRNLLVKLKKTGKEPIFERGIFFTTDIFQKSTVAKENLSLSFSPKYIMRIKRDPSAQGEFLYKNTGCRILTNLISLSDSRVWPAFGHIGGATEIILTDGKNVTRACTDRSTDESPSSYISIHNRNLIQPYVNDLFHQDDVANFTSAIFQRLSGETITAIINDEPNGESDEERRKFEFPNEGGKEEATYIGNINSANGISFKINKSKSKVQYSLSIGISCDPKLKSILIMFWGFAWEDLDTLRFYYGPVTTSYVWHDSRDTTCNYCECLKWDFLQELCDPEKREIRNIERAIHEVLSRLRPIGDNYFDEGEYCRLERSSKYPFLLCNSKLLQSEYITAH